jgi:hypothetical protein
MRKELTSKGAATRNRIATRPRSSTEACSTWTAAAPRPPSSPDSARTIAATRCRRGLPPDRAAGSSCEDDQTSPRLPAVDPARLAQWCEATRASRGS